MGKQSLAFTQQKYCSLKNNTITLQQKEFLEMFSSEIRLTPIVIALNLSKRENKD